MKRLLTLLLAPLLVLMLSSATPQSVEKQQVRGSDSTTVSIQFSPAQIVVKDNRTTSGIVSIIERNSESNAQVADAIEKIAEVSSRALTLQERRYDPLVGRISQQTGLTSIQIEKILHKKRVYDITFYTLFVFCVLYFLYALITFQQFAGMLNMKEWIVRVASYLLISGMLWLLYYCVGRIINGANYELIKPFINSPPG